MISFDKFVLPLYDRRLETKAELGRMKKLGQSDTAEYIEVKKDDIFLKLLLNNGYGKFAQNPSAKVDTTCLSSLMHYDFAGTSTLNTYLAGTTDLYDGRAVVSVPVSWIFFFFYFFHFY